MIRQCSCFFETRKAFNDHQKLKGIIVAHIETVSGGDAMRMSKTFHLTY